MGKPQNVDEYFASIAEEWIPALRRLRETIQATVPDATETIYYGMPAFKVHGRTLVSYAAFKDHCSLYPMSMDVIHAYEDELEPYRTSTGTLQFTPKRPIPKALVRKIVKARVAENAARAKKK